jgi:hypothetical protein
MSANSGKRPRRDRPRQRIGADLTAVGPVVRLVRRRRSPSAAWTYRGVCSSCGPLGDGWTHNEQAATEEAFAHAIEHVEPRQLRLGEELGG